MTVIATLRILRPAALALACGIGAAPHATAALVSGTLDFTATGFALGAPHASVTGRVAYSFDNSAGFVNRADGQLANGAPVHVSILSSSLPGTWTPVLSYFTVFNGQPADFFAIGHAPTTFVGPGTDDWRVAINGTHGAPAFRELTYAVSSIGDRTFMTFSGSVTPVPEPQTWALMAGGLGLLGWRLQRRGR